MTREEAETVARIIGYADGGCQYCVASLAEKLSAAGLGYTFTLTQDYGVSDEAGANFIPVAVSPTPPIADQPPKP